MAGLCGKWELVSCDDSFLQYMEAVGVGEEKRQMAMKGLTAGSKVVQEISRDGNKWTVKIMTTQGEKVDCYVEGESCDVTTLDGRIVSVTYTLNGDELVELQKGQGFESRNVRKCDGDQMTFTFTTGNICCARVYKRIS